MASSKLGYWFPLLGLAFAVAGADKLFAVGSYRRLPQDLGWPMGAMQAVAAGELVGGGLLLTQRTRQLGGAVLATSCVAMLAGEVRHRQGSLALPRLALLVAALTAFLPQQRAAVTMAADRLALATKR